MEMGVVLVVILMFGGVDYKVFYEVVGWKKECESVWYIVDVEVKKGNGYVVWKGSLRVEKYGFMEDFERRMLCLMRGDYMGMFKIS